MIKKIFLGVVIILAVLIAALIALPFLFKDKLFALAEEQANNNVNATVSMGDLDLTFFKHFPELTLVLTDLQVVGKAPFDGLELAYIKEFSVSVDVLALLSGGAIEINGIYLVDPRIHVLVLEDGTANYDISLPDTAASTAETDTTATEGSFNLALKRYAITNATVIYDDRQGGQYAHLEGLNHGGNGDFTTTTFLLETHTEAQKLSYAMEGVPYLNRVEFESDFDLLMDLDKMRFEFGENNVRLNALQLAFSGWLAMPDEAEEPIDLDFTFSTPQTDFKSILSLVPAVYATDFENVETSGQLALQGFAKGRMVGEQLPAFDLKLVVDGARFKYPDLPESAENISINLQVSNPGGSDDNTVIDLSRFHLELAKNPVDAALYLTTPMSDPNIKATLSTNLDLASLGAVVPLEEGQKLSGRVEANLSMAGRQSAIDAERYDEFSASGTLGLSAIEYTDPSLPYSTIIESCQLEFAPQFVSLTEFAMRIGRSDIQLTGKVNNLLSWYASGAELDGDLAFSSNLLDLNEFMTEEEAAESEASVTEETEESTGVIEVPAGYRFKLKTSVAKMIYENLEITNIEGSCAIADKKLSMSGLGMDLLEGQLTMSGHYETSNPAVPTYSYAMDASNWDCQATYKYLDLAAKLAPIMEHATGSYGLNMNLNGKLDANMEPILNTLSGSGVLTSSSIGLDKPATLSQAAELLKFNGFDKTELNDINLKFEIKNGRLEVDPLEFVMAREIPSIFSGAHSLVGELDYVLNLDIPTKALGSSAAVNNLVGAAGAKLGADVAVPERIKADVKIGGTSLKPVVSLAKLQLGEGGVKDAINAEIDQQKDALEAEARAKADEAEAEARARAEADKAKADATARAKKAEDEAKAKAAAAAKAKEEEAKKRAEEEKKKAAEAAKKKLGGMLK